MYVSLMYRLWKILLSNMSTVEAGNFWDDLRMSRVSQGVCRKEAILGRGCT